MSKNSIINILTKETSKIAKVQKTLGKIGGSLFKYSVDMANVRLTCAAGIVNSSTTLVGDVVKTISDKNKNKQELINSELDRLNNNIKELENQKYQLSLNPEISDERLKLMIEDINNSIRKKEDEKNLILNSINSIKRSKKSIKKENSEKYINADIVMEDSYYEHEYENEENNIIEIYYEEL